MGEKHFSFEHSQFRISKIGRPLHAVRREFRAAKQLMIHCVYEMFEPAVEMYSDESFDLSRAIAGIKDPVTEIGGPTKSGYWFGSSFVDLGYLQNRVLITNVYGQKGIDCLVNGSHLPFRDESLGAVFASYLPIDIRTDVLQEVGRVLVPNGLFFWQAGEPIRNEGFSTKGMWAENGYRPVHLVFEKI